MEKQKKQMLALVIALVICVAAYFAVSHFAKNVTETDDGPNAYMGNVTESLMEETEEATEEATETVMEEGTEVTSGDVTE
jgi:predicted lysophospholipase L1 biosynthesis ABC-type transport system permease subunit